MDLAQMIWDDPVAHIRQTQPDAPVLYAAPSKMAEQAKVFTSGFPGQVTFAVKANPDALLIRTLAQAGVSAFDVASPREIDLVARVAPGMPLHYNNPVRSVAEIRHAAEAGVASYSVDCRNELDKLIAQVPAGREIAVRFRLPVEGGAYDFGTKFGADPAVAVDLLKTVAQNGYQPALTFHPGTQCERGAAWESYIHSAAEIAGAAGVRIARLNVGGGFPSHRRGAAPDLAAIFAAIRGAVATAFPDAPPDVICEPGRALAAEGYSLAVRIKAVRDDGSIFLNDGIYGGLFEASVMGNLTRVDLRRPDGTKISGPMVPVTLFGPTCDSMDRLPDGIELPAGLAEGDYLLFHGAGAYCTATATRFNGYGELQKVIVRNVAF